MEISSFLNMNLQKGDGLLLKYYTGEVLQGNYRGDYDPNEISFSFFNQSTGEIQTVAIQRLLNLDVTSRASS